MEGRARKKKVAPRLRGKEAWEMVVSLVQRLEALCDQRKTRLVDAFRHFDLNKDGTISPDEMEQAIHELGISMTVDEKVMLLYRLDKDGDDVIDLGEMLELVRETRRHMPVKKERGHVGQGMCSREEEDGDNTLRMLEEDEEEQEKGPVSGGFRIGNQFFLMTVTDGNEIGSFTARLLNQNDSASTPEELTITAQTASEAGLLGRSAAFAFLRDDLVRVYNDTVKKVQQTLQAEGMQGGMQRAPRIDKKGAKRSTKGKRRQV
jgi:hypothetical protein